MNLIKLSVLSKILPVILPKLLIMKRNTANHLREMKLRVSVLAIVGIAVAAALAVGIIAGVITYAILEPSNKLDEPDSNKVASVAQAVLCE
ncbi:hypothetical protein [Wolbachia endosymbiont (group A) of Longitarsus flavicornis]|uniref:hypothetical protein n=1 Tax=Wolbachia endosymbiont (group A) of Longitarsus flavicornis TaxID=3066134 RepID=UPI0030CA349C